MGKVRRLTYFHGEAVIFVKTERRCNSAKVLTFVVEDKGIILHRDVKFSEKFVA